MICLELNWFIYDPSRILQLSEFVWTLRSSVWIFLLIDATDRSKISSDHHRIFFDASLYPHSFFTNTLFKMSLEQYFNVVFNLWSNLRHFVSGKPNFTSMVIVWFPKCVVILFLCFQNYLRYSYIEFLSDLNLLENTRIVFEFDYFVVL